jgi:hypothetical protein
MGSIFGGSFWQSHLLRNTSFHLSAGLCCFALSWLLFEHRCQRGGDDSDFLAVSQRRHWWQHWFPPGRAQSNAIAWKDFHFFYGGFRSLGLRLLAYAGIAIGAWAFSVNMGSIKTLPGSFKKCGWIFFSVELAVFATLFLSREYWGKTLGAILSLPSRRRIVIKQKLIAGALLLTPSVALISVGLLAENDLSMDSIWNDLFARNRYPRGWISVVSSIAGHTAFFYLTANLSLRIRWAALPTALGIALFFQIFLQITGSLLLEILLRISILTRGDSGIITFSHLACGRGGATCRLLRVRLRRAR